MKKILRKFAYLLGLCFVATPVIVSAQSNLQPVQYQNYVPTGACTLPNYLTVVTSGSGAGTYQCIAGSWVELGSGGGGTPGGASFSVQYNNAGSFGGSTPCTGVGYFNTAAAPGCATPTQVLGAFSTNIVYASKVSGAAVLPVADCAAGASATGLTDSYSVLNALTNAGSVDLEVDGCFALSAALNIGSNTTIHATIPGAGFIMLPAANAPVLQNVHLNAPTTASGTGGFLVSNQTDSNVRIVGLMLNSNSTQAATGTNAASTPHSATPGGKFTYCTNFVGVNGITLEHNECYDSAAFEMFFSNDSNGSVNYNYIHAPTPIVSAKLTDCLHWTGPDTNFVATGNTLTCGDDSIAFNANDGNTPSSGDANGSYIASYVKYGPITNMNVTDSTLQGTYYGVRTLSATELIDSVSVQNTVGTLCGTFGSLYPAYTSLGTGNYGSVKLDGIQVTDTWSCPSTNYFINTGGTFKSLQISHLTLANPAASYPIITQTVASSGSLLLSDWTIDTNTSTFTSLINTTTSPGKVTISGLNWNDTIGTGSVFAGATVPATLTASNCALPGSGFLLASGYVPTYQNGDCFTNTYPTVTTYINTVFNEASAGTALAGTTPATCTNGCVGPWVYSGTGFNYLTGGGIQATTSMLSVPAIINTGVTNEVIRFNLTTCSGSSGPCAVALRYTNISNFIAVNLAPTTGIINAYDVVAGTATLIGTCTGTSASILGNYTISLNGTHATIAGPFCTTPVMTTANTGTNMGFQNDNTSIYTITSLSARSQ